MGNVCEFHLLHVSGSAMFFSHDPVSHAMRIELGWGFRRMAESQDDYRQLIQQKRFLGEIEQGIRAANRQLIHQRVPSLDRDSILNFAVAVGRLRARYLEAAFKLGVNEHGDPPDQAEINELRIRREMFEEARSAFEALREAIEKGYLDVDDLTGAHKKK